MTISHVIYSYLDIEQHLNLVYNILHFLVIATVSEVCSKIYFEGDKIPYSNGTVVNQNDEFMKKTPLPEEIIPPSSEKFITNGLGRLALRLQSVIGLPRTNTVFSPLSVALALALVLLGSRGRTYIELTSALGLSNNTDKTLVEELHQSFGRLFHSLEQDSDDGVLLTLASGVFVQEGFNITDEYIAAAKALYKGEVIPLDFVRNSAKSTDFINRWVENRTDNHIKDILNDHVSTETRVVIVNAIFFNGNWESPFPIDFTKKQKFYVSPTKFVNVDMMVNVADAFYYGDKEKQLLGLPYRGRETVMYFLRPFNSLDDYMQTLTPQELLEMVGNTTFTSTIYSVPRMKLEESLSLQQALEHLGVKTLFHPLDANLSGLAPGLYVNSVLQKVEVIVSETGTMASAATALDLVRSGGPLVRLDKPFLFFIYDVPSRLVSFWGTVYNPNSPY